MFAAQVRVDPQDNIWVVDEMSAMVMKFDPQGRVAMLLGRKAEAVNNPPRVPVGRTRGRRRWRGGGAAGAGPPQDLFNRPTDVAWDAAGQHLRRRWPRQRAHRQVRQGRQIREVLGHSRGTDHGEFANVLSIAVDAQGNVYAGDGGNKRIQVFDNNGIFKTRFQNFGNAQAMCITPGANPVLYVSNSNPPNDIDAAGEIYKMRLDGTVLGKFGRAGSCSRNSARSTPSTAAAKTRSLSARSAISECRN